MKKMLIWHTIVDKIHKIPLTNLQNISIFTYPAKK